jgi:LPXTG-motif cell wall-anchored protein
MKLRTARPTFILLGIAAVLALSATVPSAHPKEEGPTGATGPTAPTGPTGQIAPTAQGVPTAPVAPAPPAPAGPTGEVGAQGEVSPGGGGGGEVGEGGGGRELAQAPAGQVAAAEQVETSQAPTELARTGTNLVGLALIAALCLVGAALVFPRKSRKRAVS